MCYVTFPSMKFAFISVWHINFKFYTMFVTRRGLSKFLNSCPILLTYKCNKMFNLIHFLVPEVQRTAKNFTITIQILQLRYINYNMQQQFYCRMTLYGVLVI